MKELEELETDERLEKILREKGFPDDSNLVVRQLARNNRLLDKIYMILTSIFVVLFIIFLMFSVFYVNFT